MSSGGVSCFHTPYGVTSFRTVLLGDLTTGTDLFPYALWRDLVSDIHSAIGVTPVESFHTPYGVTSFRTSPTTRSARGGRFPYALWRDLVSDELTPCLTPAPQGFHTPYGVTSFRTGTILTYSIVSAVSIRLMA